MSKICPLCGGVAVKIGKNLLSEDVYECTLCHEPGHHSRFKEDATIFNRITASLEVLAEEFVGLIFDHRFTSKYRYFSKLTREFYDTKPEAIAATVAKLKEVEE